MIEKLILNKSLYHKQKYYVRSEWNPYYTNHCSLLQEEV